jgi:hypothetical protein
MRKTGVGTRVSARPDERIALVPVPSAPSLVAITAIAKIEFSLAACDSTNTRRIARVNDFAG